MFNLSGIEIYEVIHENDTVSVYRGYSTVKQKPVIVKVAKKTNNRSSGVSNLIHEYEITSRLNIENIIKPMETHHMDLFSATVIEGIEGISLSRYIKDNILNRSEGIESINEFLDIAISITENICRLHQEGLILRNLNPDGILINPDNAKTYIIDLVVQSI